MRSIVKKTSSHSLSFEALNDALDHARHLVKDSNRRLAANRMTAFKAYSEGQLEIASNMRIWSHHAKYELIFSAVPFRRERIIPKSFHFSNIRRSNPKIHRDEMAMFALSTHVVKGPKGFIPSMIRLERMQKSNDATGKSGATLLNTVAKPQFVAREGEINIVKRFNGRINSNGYGKNGLIQTSSQIFSGIGCNVRKGIGKPFPSRLQFKNLMDSVIVGLNHHAVWLSIRESHHAPFKITDVFLRPRNPMLGTLKRIR